jgi:sortase (surface protein transpeptidase)
MRLLLAVVGCVLLGAICSSVIRATTPQSPVPCPWIIPTGVSGPTPKTLAWLDIPRLGIHTPIYRGTTVLLNGGEDNSVNHGPTLYPASVSWGKLPEQDGVMGVLGHRTTHTHPFCRLDLMQTGFIASVQVKRMLYTYKLVYIDLAANPKSWVYFKHPQWYDNGEVRPARGVPLKYFVAAACTPPRQKTHRINAVFRLVQIDDLSN